MFLLSTYIRFRKDSIVNLGPVPNETLVYLDPNPKGSLDYLVPYLEEVYFVVNLAPVPDKFNLDPVP